MEVCGDGFVFLLPHHRLRSSGIHFCVSDATRRQTISNQLPPALGPNLRDDLLSGVDLRDLGDLPGVSVARRFGG